MLVGCSNVFVLHKKLTDGWPGDGNRQLLRVVADQLLSQALGVRVGVGIPSEKPGSHRLQGIVVYPSGQFQDIERRMWSPKEKRQE